jgi:hypothetical protein
MPLDHILGFKPGYTVKRTKNLGRYGYLFEYIP